MAQSVFLPATEVQSFLDSVGKGETFVVHFAKQNGEDRLLVGNLDPTTSVKAERKLAVPIQTEDGWKSFLVDRVYSIKRKD